MCIRDSSYSNEQLSLICGSIGTVLLHTKIRYGASKAKIERQWRTLKESWLYTLDPVSYTHLPCVIFSIFAEISAPGASRTACPTLSKR